MCGIFGFNWEDKILLKRMSSVLKHRGPDDTAFYEDKNISLGMRRLAIIDLKKGIYPVMNETEDLITIFNGEIYNYEEIKQDLQKKGHKFITDTDAEIIPHAYEEYGIKFISKFNGMFAIAMYDKQSKKLFLFRDRLGIKPLYYFFDKNKLAFASEMKLILEIPGFEKQINEPALNSYFTYRYFPGEEAIFKDVKKLLPGHYLVYDGKKITTKQYWNFDFDYKTTSLKNNSKKLLELLEDSVKLRLMSDVPLGAYLSGGLDSSAIVALMARHSDDVNTFTVSFSNTEFDESKYAQLVADTFETNHTQINVEVDAVKTLPKVAWHLDEPIADAATIPVYLMSKETKKLATVVLTGEGSDELFGGYERFRHLNIANKFQKIPKTFRKIPSKVLNKENILHRRGSNLLENLDTPEKAYMSYYPVFDEYEKQELYNNDKIKKNYFKMTNYFKDNLYESMLKIDIKERLPNNMLLKNDKMTMAASIEGRVPFLDHRIAEFAGKIPFNQKVSYLQDKIVYRKAIQNLVPKTIVKRKKQGFTIPTTKWVKQGLKEHLFDLIKENKEPYLSKKYIEKIVSKINKSFYYKRQFWAVLMYEQWYKEYINV